MTDQQKRSIMAEEIWLNYYNDYLYEHKVITEKEHIKMCNEIATHCDRKRKQANKSQDRDRER